MGLEDSDREKYSTISISDDEDIEEKSIFSKTIEIPKIILSKREKRSKEDYFEKAVRYNPSPEEGLNALQVDERQTHRLTNKQAKTLSKSYLRIVMDNVLTFFNILLITIGIFLIAVEDYKDCFFLLIVLANTVIGIAQEVRAKQIVDKLSLINSPEVKVRRDGIKAKIATDQLVLDDIFYLSTGNEIPADSYIVKGEVEVNESMLTGESLPVKKSVGGYVLAGAYVVSGSCLCRCDRIGEHNYVAQLQNKARKVKKAKSILLTSLNKIIRYISAIIIPLGIALALNNYSVNHDYIETIKKAGASLVTMIPSGLFLLISTTLTVSVIALAKRKTMVQDSYAIETLARADAICLDKTGTITDGTMRLEEEVPLKKTKEPIADLMGAFLGAFEETNVTSQALLKAYPSNRKYPIKVILPFSSARKLSAVEFEGIGTYVLGAPEFICKNEEILKMTEPYAEKGFRVLLLGHTRQHLKDDIVFKNIVPVSLFVLSDHIRDEAYDTIRWFNENSVKIKIISGDNPITVSQIAGKVGVPNANRYISLDGLSNEEVAEIADDYTVFGRVSPEQKAVLIRALKNSGNTVAMTGDGVNDILAMKQANCSIAMASGSEAARNASHLVLMDSNFASMPKVVEEGRKVINNIQRSASLFLMKTIYSIIFAFIGILAWIFQFPFVQPFDLCHLYILEFAVIGFPSFFLALQPNTALISGSFMKNVLSKSLPGGIALLFSVGSIMVIDNFAVFDIASHEIMVTMASLALSFTGLSILFEICRPFNKYRVVLFSLMLILSVLYITLCPISISALYVFELNWKNWLTMIVIVIIAMVFYGLTETFRNIYIRKHEQTNR